MSRYNDTHKIINGEIHKLCKICKEWKMCNDENFYKNKSNKSDGLNPYCKKCTINKTLTTRDVKRTMELNKYYYKTRKKSRDVVKEASKRRREKGLQLNWQRNNKEKVKEYNVKRRHKNHNITDKEWEYCKQYFNYSCAYCGLSEEEHKNLYNQQLHKEHVDHDGLNDLSNCVPACKVCNSCKNDKKLVEWYNTSNKDFNIEKLDKIMRWLHTDYELIQ